MTPIFFESIYPKASKRGRKKIFGVQKFDFLIFSPLHKKLFRLNISYRKYAVAISKYEAMLTLTECSRKMFAILRDFYFYILLPPDKGLDPPKLSSWPSLASGKSLPSDGKARRPSERVRRFPMICSRARPQIPTRD